MKKAYLFKLDPLITGGKELDKKFLRTNKLELTDYPQHAEVCIVHGPWLYCHMVLKQFLESHKGKTFYVVPTNEGELIEEFKANERIVVIKEQ